ncbi:MAG: flagellar basal body-associated FliL family protein [Phycisphaerae bacterium]
MAPEDTKEDQTQKQAGGKSRGRLKPLIIVGALMLAEGVGIFAMMSFFGAAPESTVAAEDEAALQDPLNLEAEVEVELCEVDAYNRKEGRLYVYSLKLSALVAAEDVAKINRFIKARSASINDRVQVVIRSADPKHLNDPSLESIKRQIIFEINNLLGGEELIRDVLVSKLLQSRTNL